MKIPKASEQVVVHEAEPTGPKDSQGRSVLNPIKREQTRFKTPVLVVSAIGAVMVPAIAFVLGKTFEVENGTRQAPMPILALGAILVSYPIVLAGYTILRNDEIESYKGKDLYLRGGVCALVFALTWGIHAYLCHMMGFSSPMEVQHAFIAVPVMFVPGAIASLATLDLDGFSASIHYGFYLLVTVVLRVIMGIGPL